VSEKRINDYIVARLNGQYSVAFKLLDKMSVDEVRQARQEVQDRRQVWYNSGAWREGGKQ
jgi:hypothetical protein